MSELRVPTRFDPDRPWRLHPRVALRPEPFGALAYHYDNRKLNFVRSHELVALLEDLGAHDTAAEAVAAAVADRRRPTFLKALENLAASDFIEPRPEEPSRS